MITIDSQEFNNFIRRSTIEKSVDKFLLNFREDGIRFIENDPPKYITIRSLLKRETFKDYEAIGEIVIGNTELFMKAIDRFVGLIEIKVEENKFIINGLDINRDLQFTLSTIESLGERILNEETAHNGDLKIKVSSSKLKEAFRNARDIGTGEYLFKTERGKLIIESGDIDIIREIFIISNIDVILKVKFGEPLSKVIDILYEEVDLSLKDSYPIRIILENNKVKYDFIVANKES